MTPRTRAGIAGLVLSASGLVFTVSYEGYTNNAVIPIPGDVPTIGFGTTQGVKMGDKTTPPKALGRALSDIQKYEGAIKTCVKVPLYQFEYDSLVDFTYNVGAEAFCGSTLAKKLNAGDYAGACLEIKKWNKFQGRPNAGLTKRRAAEYARCIGDS